MRSAITLLASLVALTAAAPAADARPLPEIQCGVAGCPTDPITDLLP